MQARELAAAAFTPSHPDASSADTAGMIDGSTGGDVLQVNTTARLSMSKCRSDSPRSELINITNSNVKGLAEVAMVASMLGEFIGCVVIALIELGFDVAAMRKVSSGRGAAPDSATSNT
jgi:hypothetical protein